MMLANPTSGSILLVDDEPSLRQTFTQILRQAGWQVTTAADGPEGLRRLAGDHFDLVFLDIRLPGMDGLELLGMINHLYEDLPVVLLTAHASLQTALDAIRLGAVDYLLKPIKPAALIQRTQAILVERAKRRRRQKIYEQIAALQAELTSLDAVSPAVLPAP
ncbi:MAG: response regulator, partial [Chloroflexi bacterium]|nr:response regulator [Chloroflexota bacterium]MCI0731170.1 response regulator [Chloroflexota bacterium]